MDDRYVSFCSSGTIRNRYTVGTRRIALTALSLAGIGAILTPAQQTAGTPGSARATATITGKQLPTTRSDVRRGDHGQGLGFNALVAPARCAA